MSGTNIYKTTRGDWAIIAFGRILGRYETERDAAIALEQLKDTLVNAGKMYNDHPY